MVVISDDDSSSINKVKVHPMFLVRIVLKGLMMEIHLLF